MKIDNSKYVKPIMQIIYVIIGVLFVVGSFFIFVAEERFDHRIPNKFYIFFGIFLVIFIFWLGHIIFFYDSLGETITIRNKTYYPLEFLDREVNNAEFPKRKIIDFKIKHVFLFKRKLVLTIKSKNAKSGKMNISYGISFLNKNDLKDLKISLRNILKENRKNKKIEN